jgi:hypothetical protein
VFQGLNKVHRYAFSFITPVFISYEKLITNDTLFVCFPLVNNNKNDLAAFLLVKLSLLDLNSESKQGSTSLFASFETKYLFTSVGIALKTCAGNRTWSGAGAWHHPCCAKHSLQLALAGLTACGARCGLPCARRSAYQIGDTWTSKFKKLKTQ